MLKRIGFIAVISTLLLALPAFASFTEEVARDLGVKTATLVAPAGEEWLIDLDASAGVQAGDLFVIVTKGAPVIHPVSKKVIGTLDETRAVLRVTKVKSGYSYTSVLMAEDPLKAGDEARRFAGLPALFWDYTGEGEGVFAQLQGALPELNWQSYVFAQAQRPEPPRPVAGMAPGLIFVLNAQGLGVKDHQFQPLRFYRPEQLGRGPVPATAAATTSGTIAAVPMVVPAPSGASIVAPAGQAAAVPGSASPGILSGIFGGGSKPQAEGAGGVLPGYSQRGGLIVSQMDSKEGVWYGPRVDGKPIGVEVGDFDGDGKQEVALGFKDRLVVARVIAGQYTVLADHPFERSGDALSLDGLDLDRNGRVELYVTLAQMGGEISATAFEMQNGQLIEVVKAVPYFVRKVNLLSEGYVLLGQEINPDLSNHNQELAGPIFRVSRSGDTLQRGTVVNLPQEVTLYGFQPFEHAGRALLARFNINDKLQLLESSGATLWESSEYFGGSENSFERSAGMNDGSTRYAFLQPRLELGPDGTVLVPVNEGNRTFSAFRAFNSSHLRAVAFDGYSMVERWRTKPQGGYLGDFRMADADNDGAPEIVMLVMFSRGNWGKVSYGNSALLIYEMQ